MSMNKPEQENQKMQSDRSIDKDAIPHPTATQLVDQVNMDGYVGTDLHFSLHFTQRR